MQAPPPTGCTDIAPPPSPAVGATLEDGAVAPLSGSSAPATPNPTANTRATPPQTAAAVLPMRIVTDTNCSFLSRDAHGDTECFSRARRESGRTGGGGE
jgi:hypothetical protein